MINNVVVDSILKRLIIWNQLYGSGYGNIFYIYK